MHVFFCFCFVLGFFRGGGVTLYPYNLFEMFELEAYSFHNYDELITQVLFQAKNGLNSFLFFLITGLVIFWHSSVTNWSICFYLIWLSFCNSVNLRHFFFITYSFFVIFFTYCNIIYKSIQYVITEVNFYALLHFFLSVYYMLYRFIVHAYVKYLTFSLRSIPNICGNILIPLFCTGDTVGIRTCVFDINTNEDLCIYVLCSPFYCNRVYKASNQ